MIERLALVVGTVLLVGGAAGAQTSAPMANATATPAKPKMICRKEVAVGSLMPTRTCHTKEDWAAIDQRNGDAAAAGRDVHGGAGSLHSGGGLN